MQHANSFDHNYKICFLPIDFLFPLKITFCYVTTIYKFLYCSLVIIS